MNITYIRLKNWRNFREIESRLSQRAFIIGPNASGKSNFLDVFRFLRDICKPNGGGLQRTIEERGGISKLRCLHARRDPEVMIEIHLIERSGSTDTIWEYTLGFKSEGKGAQRLIVSHEIVEKDANELLVFKQALKARKFSQ